MTMLWYFYGVICLTVYFVMCRSITSAQRCARLLDRALIRTAVVKAPKELTVRGCGYALRLHGKVEKDVVLLRKNAMPLGKVFSYEPDGEYREVSI